MAKNLEKEFVTYEQALALQELGFDEECMADCMGFACDFKDGEYITTHEQIFYPNDSITPNDLEEELELHCVHICGIPLKQQVFRWLSLRLNDKDIMIPVDYEAQDKLIDVLIDKLKTKHLLL